MHLRQTTLCLEVASTVSHHPVQTLSKAEPVFVQNAEPLSCSGVEPNSKPKSAAGSQERTIFKSHKQGHSAIVDRAVPIVGVDEADVPTSDFEELKAEQQSGSDLGVPDEHTDTLKLDLEEDKVTPSLVSTVPIEAVHDSSSTDTGNNSDLPSLKIEEMDHDLQGGVDLSASDEKTDAPKADVKTDRASPTLVYVVPSEADDNPTTENVADELHLASADSEEFEDDQHGALDLAVSVEKTQTLKLELEIEKGSPSVVSKVPTEAVHDSSSTDTGNNSDLLSLKTEEMEHVLQGGVDLSASDENTDTVPIQTPRNPTDEDLPSSEDEDAKDDQPQQVQMGSEDERPAASPHKTQVVETKSMNGLPREQKGATPGGGSNQMDPTAVTIGSRQVEITQGADCVPQVEPASTFAESKQVFL